MMIAGGLLIDKDKKAGHDADVSRGILWDDIKALLIGMTVRHVRVLACSVAIRLVAHDAMRG